MFKMSRGTGSCPELCQGNEKYEDVKHTRVIQIQQAFQEGVDSVEPCREAVWRHHGQAQAWRLEEIGPQKNYTVSADTQI